MKYDLIFFMESFYYLDFNFAPRHLVNIVNDNPVESQILQVNSDEYIFQISDALNHLGLSNS